MYTQRKTTQSTPPTASVSAVGDPTMTEQCEYTYIYVRTEAYWRVYTPEERF